MPILKNAHNVPGVPVASRMSDSDGMVTQEWAHYFRELSDHSRHIADVEVLARRAWMPISQDEILDASYGCVTFGLDTDAVGTNSPGKYVGVVLPGAPYHCNISCVTIPTTAAAIFDVLVSHDGGSTWNSIFASGNPFRFPQSYATHLIEYDAIFSGLMLQMDDLIRVDTIQSGGAAGITGVIRWQ